MHLAQGHQDRYGMHHKTPQKDRLHILKDPKWPPKTKKVFSADKDLFWKAYLWRRQDVFIAPAKPSCRAGDWAHALPHAERVWYHYTNCPLQAEAPRGAQKALFFRLWARVFLALCFLIGVCCVSSFLVLCGGVSAFVVRGACTYGSLLEPAPTALMSALMKMYLRRRRCIYEGVSADEDVFMKAKMYLWRCQRWRRCIYYEAEDVFMKVSALTKMHLWRRRCIYEGVSADEDVFMKAKMYSWRCPRWQRCVYEGKDVFMKVSVLTKMYSWRRRCIPDGVIADEDAYMNEGEGVSANG